VRTAATSNHERVEVGLFLICHVFQLADDAV
jgi:hypothetical protein